MNDIKNKEGPIFITKEAFRNMITHVLRFADDSLDTKYEVIGFCLGKQDENNNMMLMNAIPISHGKDIQIGISQSYLDLLKKIEDNYKDQDLKVIGWYISHPSGGIEWNEQDRKNHLYIQTNKKPKAFSIVFDHKLLKKENNFGLKIYSFIDYKKGEQGKYDSIDFEIEEPKTMDYFKWIQKFVEDFYKNNPILISEVKEVSETIPKDLQEIPTAPIDDFMEIESLPLEKLQSSYTTLINNTNELIYEDIKKIMVNLNQITIEASTKLLNLLYEINEGLSSGMNNLKNWSKSEILGLTERVKETAKDLINKNIAEQKNFESKISDIKNKIEEKTLKIVSEQFKNSSELLKIKIQSLEGKINELKTMQNDSKVDIDKSNEKITNIKNKFENEINNFADTLKKDIDENNSKKINELNLVKSKIDNFEKIITDISRKVKDLDSNIDSLKKI
ncbi:MAG: hypothetical protein JXA99_01865 [Candidatus Lokiarchaeota archaeon]|nr:hypothetical protein [Candidatus Lokiarchaeota archaeon]